MEPHFENNESNFENISEKGLKSAWLENLHIEGLGKKFWYIVVELNFEYSCKMNRRNNVESRIERIERINRLPAVGNASEKKKIVIWWIKLPNCANFSKKVSKEILACLC